MEYWFNILKTGKGTGASVAHGFIFSPELRNRVISNDMYIEILYKTLLGRGSDAGGKTYWVNRLTSGSIRESIFSGFVNSQEFTKICSQYGITRGSYTEPAASHAAVWAKATPTTQPQQQVPFLPAYKVLE